MRDILKQNKVSQKPHFLDPSLHFRKRVKCVAVGHIWALKGPGEGPLGMDLTDLCLPDATVHWQSPAGIEWHMPWLPVSRTDLREGMEEDYEPNKKASSWQPRKVFPHGTCSWALTDVKDCTYRACPVFIPEVSPSWWGKKKVGITQTFQTHCTLCTFHTQWKGRKC